MPFAPVTIPGVRAPLTTTYSFWSGFVFSVDGQRVKPHGFPRNRLALPGTEGPVEGRIKGVFLRAHPPIVVRDTECPTGPPTPRVFQVLAVMPLLSIVVFQGVLGFVLAFGAMATNMGIVRGSASTAAKIVSMIAVAALVAAVDVAVLAVVMSD